MIRSALFLAAAGVTLFIVAFACQRWLPDPSPIESSLADFLNGSTEEKGWWARFMDKFKTPEIHRRLQRPSGKNAQAKKIVKGTGLASTVTDREQLLLRQKILAELHLADYEGRPPKTVLERTQLPFGHYPWKAYEVDRMRTAVFAERFEDSYDDKWLKPLLKSANRASISDFANFEDFFWAGRANMFSGNLRQARNNLMIAERRWPVRNGILFGMTALMLAVTDAVTDRPDSMLKRVESIRETFPDWSYSEIYQRDFEVLEAKYPNEPLLLMLHGRLLAMGFNDAKAMELYERAMRMSKLRGVAKVRLRQWLDALEELHGS